LAVKSLSKFSTTAETSHVFRTKSSGQSVIATAQDLDPLDDSPLERERKRPKLDHPRRILAFEEGEEEAVVINGSGLEMKKNSMTDIKPQRRKQMVIDLPEEGKGD